MPGRLRMIPWDRRLSPSSRPQFSPGEAEARQTQCIGATDCPLPGGYTDLCSTRLLLPSPELESSVTEHGWSQ